MSVCDVVDGEEAEVSTRNINNALSPSVRCGRRGRYKPSRLRPAISDILLREISSARQARRACEFGRGLAKGTLHLEEMWAALKVAYAAAAPESCNPFMMGGFLTEAHVRDPDFAAPALDAAIDDPNLAPFLPYLQAVRSTIDEAGIARLRTTAIAKGALSSKGFQLIRRWLHGRRAAVGSEGSPE